MKGKLALLTTLALIGLVVVPAVARPQRETFIIVFNRDLRAHEVSEFVKKYEIDLKYEYSIIPAVSGRIWGHLVDDMRAHRWVAHVEPNLEYHIIATWNIEMVNAPLVWAQGVVGSATTIVAITDTGTNYGLPDLDAHYGGGYDFVTPDYDPMDDNGHGTATTAIAVGEGESIYKGVAPGASYYSLKCFDADGSGFTEDIVAAIDWAVRGADGVKGTEDDSDVISMSWGGGRSLAIRDALQAAHDAGMVLVAANGNEGRLRPSFPASLHYVIGVGACDLTGKIPWWSNKRPILVAPGVDVPVLTMSGGLAEWSGTSFSCPAVSGSVLLLLDVNPALTPSDVKTALTETSVDLGYCKRRQGAGLLDCYGAYLHVVGAGAPPD